MIDESTLVTDESQAPLPQIKALLNGAQKADIPSLPHKMGPGDAVDKTRYKVEFEYWASSLPTEQGASNRHGGRDHTALLIVREGLACNLLTSEILEVANDYCVRSGNAECDVQSKIDRAVVEHEAAPFRRFFVHPVDSEASKDSLALTKDFLSLHGYEVGAVKNMRIWREEVYRFNGNGVRLSPPLLFKRLNFG